MMATVSSSARNGISGATDAKEYCTADVARICGVSARQLQWWDEREIVRPKLNRGVRAYTPEEVLKVWIVSSLRKREISLQKIRFYLRTIDKKLDELIDSSDAFIVCSQKRVAIVGSRWAVVEILLSVNRPGVVIPMADIKARLGL